jgi:hypothetical protein
MILSGNVTVKNAYAVWCVDPGKNIQLVLSIGSNDDSMCLTMDWNTACLLRKGFNDIMDAHMPENIKKKGI